MEQTISRDGTHIGFRRSGSGPPLLLVHGATADHTRWAAISPAFEDHFTVYAMDRRGRGASGDGTDYSLQREAEDVAAVVDSIGEPVNVLGHSYGGLCSLEAALLTGGIDRLILYEPPISTDGSLYPPDFPDRLQARIDRGEYEAALVLFFEEIVQMPEHEFSAYRQLPMWPRRIQLAPTIAREMATEQSYPFDARRFAGLQTRTLLLQGGDSPPAIRRGVELLAEALPNNQVVVLSGQQHVAMDTNPGLFVRTVLQFLLP